MNILATFLRYFFELGYTLTGSYGVAIILLSVIVTVILTPFYYLAMKLENSEKEIQAVMRPKLDKINVIKKGAIRQHQIRHLYKSYNYSPLYSLRSLSSLFIQIPFFLAAYSMLSHYEGIKGVSFLFIKDLGAPDELLLGVNLLPLLMTGINILSTLMVTSFTPRDRKQSYVLAVFFLILLYTSPAGLVLYWTFNNILSMVRNLIPWLKESNIKASALHAFRTVKRLIDEGYIPLFLVLVLIYLSINYMVGWPTRPMRYFLYYLFHIILVLRLYAIYRTRSKNGIAATVLAVAVIIIASMVYSKHKPYYWIPAIMLIGMLEPVGVSFRAKELLKSCVIVALTALLPAILYFKTNPVYFNSTTASVYFLVVIGFSVVVHSAVSFSFRRIPLSRILLFTLSFVCAFMYLPLLREFSGYVGKFSLDFIVVMLIFLFIFTLFANRLKLLGVFALSAGVYLIFFSQAGEITVDNNRDFTTLSREIPARLSEMHPVDTPNVYILIYDGFPRREVLEELGMEKEYAEFSALMNDNGFKIYEDIYTLGFNSPSSISSMLNMDIVRGNHTDQQQIIAGDNLVNYLMQHNSYKTVYISPSVYMTGSSRSYYDVMLPNWTDVYVSNVLVGLMYSVLDADKLDFGPGNTSEANKHQYTKEIFEIPQQRVFYHTHYDVPGHTRNAAPCTDRTLTKWRAQMRRALDSMRDEMDILKLDPDAIIVIASDHGSWVIDDCTKDKDTIADDDITELMVIDSIGVTLAVRWPDPVKASIYDKDIHTMQDIFPLIFAYMYDSPVPLSYKPDHERSFRRHMFDGNLHKDYFPEDPQGKSNQ